MSRTFFRVIGLALALGLTCSVTSTAYAGQTFNFVFDNNGLQGPPAAPPFVGTGTVTLGDDLGAGVYTLDSLSGFALSFDLSGDKFTQSDILTSLSSVEVVISDLGEGVEQLNFSNTQMFGDGPLVGSLDLQNAAGQQLSFAPPGSGADYLYYEVDNDTGALLFGNYSAISTPAPSNLLLGAAGAVFFGLISYFRPKSRLRAKTRVCV